MLSCSSRDRGQVRLPNKERCSLSELVAPRAAKKRSASKLIAASTAQSQQQQQQQQQQQRQVIKKQKKKPKEKQKPKGSSASSSSSSSASKSSSSSVFRSMNVFFKLRGFEYGRKRREWKTQMTAETVRAPSTIAAITRSNSAIAGGSIVPTSETHADKKIPNSYNPNSLGLCRSIGLRHLVEACPGLKQSVLLGFHIHGNHLLAYTKGGSIAGASGSGSAPSAYPHRQLQQHPRHAEQRVQGQRHSRHERGSGVGRHISLEIWRTNFVGNNPQAVLWHSIVVPIENSPHLQDVGHPILSITQSSCGSLLAIAAPVQVARDSLDVRLTLAPLPLLDACIGAQRECIVRLIDLRFTVHTTDKSTVPNEHHLQEMPITRSWHPPASQSGGATAIEGPISSAQRTVCHVHTMCINLGDVLSFLDLQVQTHTRAAGDECDDNASYFAMSKPLWGADAVTREERYVQPWLCVGGRDGVEQMVSRVRCVDIGGATMRATRAAAAKQQTQQTDSQIEEHDDDDDEDDDDARVAPRVMRRGNVRQQSAVNNIWTARSSSDSESEGWHTGNDDNDDDEEEEGQMANADGVCRDDESQVCASVTIIDNFSIHVEPLIVAALAMKGIRLVKSLPAASRQNNSMRVLLSYCAQLIQMDPIRNLVELLIVVSCLGPDNGDDRLQQIGLTVDAYLSTGEMVVRSMMKRPVQGCSTTEARENMLVMQRKDDRRAREFATRLRSGGLGPWQRGLTFTNDAVFELKSLRCMINGAFAEQLVI